MQSTCGIWGGDLLKWGGGINVGGHRAHIGGYGTKWGGGARTPNWGRRAQIKGGVSEPPPRPQHPQQRQQPRIRRRLLNELLHLRDVN